MSSGRGSTLALWKLPVAFINMEVVNKFYKNGKISVTLFDGVRVGQIRYYEDGYISKLVITEKYRNKGYARYLLQFVSNSLNSKCPSIRLHVGVENKIAIKLYKSFGFFIVLLITDQSNYLMAKQL